MTTDMQARDEQDEIEKAWSEHQRKAFVGTREEWRCNDYKSGYRAALAAERSRSAVLVEAMEDAEYYFREDGWLGPMEAIGKALKAYRGSSEGV